MQPFDLPLSIKRHAKARQLKLRVNAEGLQLTIPSRLSQRWLNAWLQEQAPWLEQQWQSYSRQQQQDTQQTPLPRSLNLRSEQQTLQLEYCYEADLERTKIQLHGDTLFVYHGYAHPEKAKHHLAGELKQWLKHYARTLLEPRLRQLAQQAGLELGRVAIRDQKTRWGSCSNKRNINLNFRLIFLPGNLVFYVMAHELAHLHYLDHSAAFWRQVEVICVDYKRQDAILRNSGRDFIPAWLNILAQTGPDSMK